MKYLIDANVFIQAKDLFYQFDFCQAFWDWLETAHQAGLIGSVGKVRAELIDGPASCPARAWAQAQPGGFFIPDESDSGVMGQYGKAISWAATGGHYKKSAIDTFSDVKKADAFLIAAGMHHGHTVVTHEKPDAKCKIRVPIPTACDQLGVKHLTIYELLRLHASGTFAFKA